MTMDMVQMPTMMFLWVIFVSVFVGWAIGRFGNGRK